jgi:hypothetical protein
MCNLSLALRGKHRLTVCYNNRMKGIFGITDGGSDGRKEKTA